MATAFAGPLSRFYAGDGGDVARLAAGVEAWRADLRAAVGAKVAAELVWDESLEVTHAADLGVSGWLALRLFAFHAERTDLEMPDTVPALLELDSEWRAAQDAKFPRTLYGQLLACRLWLPGEFPVTMRVPLPDGESAEVGSVAVLADQLRWLNQRTFAQDEDRIASWSDLPAAAGGELLDAARRGFAGLWAAVVFAQRERVPIAVREC
ncbi:MAG: hypothetical protein KDC98_18140 [Planctomycetes bacterium]|nr:hypothetical protein [Planctomycetota bacterium]